MERHSPITTPYVLGGVESRIYEMQPLRPPADVPVSVINTGDTVVQVRVQGNTNYIPLLPGLLMKCNPSTDIFGTVSAGVGNVLVVTGADFMDTGMSSTGIATKTELSTLASLYTLKEFAAMNLRQNQLICEYLARITDEQLFERDLSPHVLGRHDV